MGALPTVISRPTPGRDIFCTFLLRLLGRFARVAAYRAVKGDRLRGNTPVVRETSTDVTRKGTPCDIVTLSVKDWLTFLGIIVPIGVLVVFGWLRHDRLLTEVAANQRMLTDRLERVEASLDRGAFQ